MSTTSTHWRIAPGPVAATDLDALLRHGGARVVKQAPHRAVRHVIHDGLDVHTKRYSESLIRHLRGDRARREYLITREVARRGVPTLEALAWGADATGSCLVTRTLPDAASLADVLASPLSPRFRQAVARSLGVFLARAHRAGVRHDDLHPGNLLVRRVSDEIELYLIDLDAVRLGPPLNWRSARDNLAVLDHWFALRSSSADRFRFWRAYSREAGFADDRGRARGLAVHTRQEALRFVAGLDRRCLGGNRHFRRLRSLGVSGYSVVGIDLPADADALIESAPALKRSASSAVVTLSEEVILKRVSATRWTDAFAAFFRPPPALHAYRMGHALLLRGIPTPRPLAVWHRTKWGMPADGYLLMRRVPGAVDLRRFVDSSPGAERARNVITQLGRLIHRLHEWQLSHRDLKAANLLISPRGWVMGERGLCEAAADGGDHVWLVDLAGVRRHGQLSVRRKAQDLARLNASFLDAASVTRTDRLRLLRAYLGRLGWKGWWRTIEAATRAKAERNRRSGRVLG